MLLWVWDNICSHTDTHVWPPSPLVLTWSNHRIFRMAATHSVNKHLLSIYSVSDHPLSNTVMPVNQKRHNTGSPGIHILVGREMGVNSKTKWLRWYQIETHSWTSKSDMKESYLSRRHIIGWVVKVGWEKVMFELGRNREKGPSMWRSEAKGSQGKGRAMQSATTDESLEYLRNTEKASLAGSLCARERIVGDELQGSDQEEVCHRGSRSLNHTCRDIDAIWGQ